MQVDVSVIVPVHNSKNTLEKAVSSLLENKGISLEIVLVENASADGSIRLCWKLEHEYDNVKLFSTKQKGVSHARNIGIQNAKGEYIGFLDADDYADENMYHELYGGAVKHKADMAICGYKTEGKNLKTMQESDLTQLKEMYSGKERKILPYDLLLAMTGKENVDEPVLMGSVWRSIYKTSFLKKHKIRFLEELEIGEDLLFNLESLKRVKEIYVCDQMLYHYCQTEGSVTNKIDRDTWKKYERLLEALIQFGEREHETREFWNRYNSKVQMFSSWIASEYARSNLSLRERYRWIIGIRDARRRLFRMQYPISNKISMDCMRERYWHAGIFVRGIACNIKHSLVKHKKNGAVS